MRIISCFLMLGFALFLIGCKPADSTKDKDKTKGKQANNEPTTQEKLLGKWEVKEGSKGDMPPGSIVEFLKEGKMKVSVKDGNKTVDADMTYTVVDQTIKTAHKEGDKEVTETVKIKTLTATDFSIEDEKGKVEEFKKK